MQFAFCSFSDDNHTQPSWRFPFLRVTPLRKVYMSPLRPITWDDVIVTCIIWCYALTFTRGNSDLGCFDLIITFIVVVKCGSQNCVQWSDVREPWTYAVNHMYCHNWLICYGSRLSSLSNCGLILTTDSDPMSASNVRELISIKKEKQVGMIRRTFP